MSEFLQNVSENVTGHESPEKGRPGVDSPDGPRAEAGLGGGAGPEDEPTGTPGTADRDSAASGSAPTASQDSETATS